MSSPIQSKNRRRKFKATARISSASAFAIILSSLIPVTGAIAAPPVDPVAPVASIASQPAPAVPQTDRFIVKFKDEANKNATERAKSYDKAGNENDVSIKEVKTTNTGAKVISTDDRLSPSEAKEFVKDLDAQANVDYVEPDTMMSIASAPNDPLYPNQWSFTDTGGGMRVQGALTYTRGKGQVVAVVDSGITNHSDLNANILPGYDMVSSATNAKDGDGRDANPQDQGDYRVAGDCNSTATTNSSWHGTHVAGIIAAKDNNGIGISGIAPDAQILPVRVLGTCGGYMSDIADGVIWASGGTVSGVPLNTHPAKVINLSIGGPGTCSVTTQNAINTAVSRGSVVVVAAGNSNQDASTSSPANCNNVIVVAASGKEGYLAGYSNYGVNVDVTAPGGDSFSGTGSAIASTLNSGKTTPAAESYGYMQGTSMATPHASAVAAMMLSMDPSLTLASLEAKMKSTTRALAESCNVCGTGLVDASAAVYVPGATPLIQAPQEIIGTLPAIVGTAKVGSTLYVKTGDWSPAPLSFVYQWYRSGVAVSGATGGSYALSSADVGKVISVKATGSKAGYTSVSKTSTATTVVATGTFSAPVPTVSGTRTVGSVLTAVPGSWNPAPTFAYQWYRSGQAIAGATEIKYTLTPADLGKLISVRVAGSKAGYTTAYKTSATTAAIAKGTLAGSIPTISGTLRAGYTLTANPRTWTSGTAFTYQWYRSGVAIKGATAKTYKLTTTDRYDTIKVRVTGYKTGYNNRVIYSGSTVKVP